MCGSGSGNAIHRYIEPRLAAENRIGLLLDNDKQDIASASLGGIHRIGPAWRGFIAPAQLDGEVSHQARKAHLRKGMRFCRCHS
ncbi:hypothetical protein PA598K_03217 [Paenibacillus sp. 598K]|nr:hypothetical protein PA598K_03217 [Paenibacillus sp. 598K]